MKTFKCVCVCLCFMKVRGGTAALTRARPSYFLYFVLCVRDNQWTDSRSSSWSGCSRGGAVEADAIGAQFGLTMRD